MQDRAQELLALMKRYIEAGRAEDLRSALTGERPVDIAEALRHLDGDQKHLIFALLEEERAGAVLDELDEIDKISRQDLLEHLDSKDITEIVEAVPPDEAADLLGDLPEDQTEEVLELMEEEEAREVQELLQYPEDTAGGIMTPELISVQVEMRASQAIDHLRRWADAESIFYIYVVDAEGCLLGTVPLRRLVTADPKTPMAQIIDPDAITVDVDADQEEIARIFERYDLLAVPVVDKQNRLLGRITLDDIVNVIHEETTEDVYKMAGTDDEELASQSSLGVALIRLPWLLVCLVGSFLSGGVIHFFQITLSKAIALVAFIPAITATGGNMGLQTSTVTVRGLATGHLDVSHLARVLLKEIRTAAIIGLACGGLTGLVARYWSGGAMVGVCIGTAMFIAISVAASLGILIPLLFKKVGIDPAVASGPLITTTNDIIGLFIYLGLATILMKYLSL